MQDARLRYQLIWSNPVASRMPSWVIMVIPGGVFFMIYTFWVWWRATWAGRNEVGSVKPFVSDYEVV